MALDALAAALVGVGLRPSRGGDYLKDWCPFHPNPSGRTLWVSRKTGRWGCFSTRCPRNAGGGLVELLVLRGQSIQVARSIVADIDLGEYERIQRPESLRDRDFHGVITEAHVALWGVDWGLASSVCAAVLRERAAYVQGAPLCTWAPGTPAGPGQVEHDSWEWLWYPLVHRGLSPAALELMDVGLDPHLGVLVFPLRGPGGAVRGIARRECRDGAPYLLDGCCWAPDDPQHRYVPVERGDTFFGWAEMAPRIEAGHPLVIVEGYADQLRLAGFGYCAVAKLGRQMSRGQVELAARAAGPVVLWPDLDRDGLMGAREDARRLGELRPVSVVSDHGDLKDPGHAGMTAPLAARCVASAMSRLDWICELPKRLAALRRPV